MMKKSRREAVRFTNGATHLAGTLSMPTTGAHHPALIALHAAGEGERTFTLYKHLADVLSCHGVAVLTYDRRGSGRSTGDFASASFEALANDARAGIKLLRRHPKIDPNRLGAWGVSQGGWLAPLLATHTRLKCLVVVSGAGVSAARQMDYSAETALRAAGFPDAPVSRALKLRCKMNAYYLGTLERARVQHEIDAVADEPWFPHAFIDRVLPDTVRDSKWALELGHDPAPVMARVVIPTLLLYSEDDPWVPVSESIEAWRAAAARWVEVEWIPGADHLMLRPKPKEPGTFEVSGRYSEVLIAWLAKHLKSNASRGVRHDLLAELPSLAQFNQHFHNLFDPLGAARPKARREVARTERPPGILQKSPDKLRLLCEPPRKLEQLVGDDLGHLKDDTEVVLLRFLRVLVRGPQVAH